MECEYILFKFIEFDWNVLVVVCLFDIEWINFYKKMKVLGIECG